MSETAASTSSTPGPAWLVPGAAVAEVRDPHLGSPSVKETTVVKVGKRDVVLANGQRYNVNHLTRRDGGTWGSNAELLPANDPKVEALRARIAEQEKVGAAKSAAYDFYYNSGDVAAVDVIRALAPLTDFPDELTALLDKHA